MFCISLLYYILLFQYGELLKLQLKINKGMVLPLAIGEYFMEI